MSARERPQFQSRVAKLNEQELKAGISDAASWHNDYKDTAFISIRSLPFELNEGDILTIFSQYGNPVYIHLMRDSETGKSRGFAFLKYEDQRSTVLAVDNLDGATVLGRELRVDHTYYKTNGADDAEIEQAMSFDVQDPRARERIARAADASRREREIEREMRREQRKQGGRIGPGKGDASRFVASRYDEDGVGAAAAAARRELEHPRRYERARDDQYRRRSPSAPTNHERNRDRDQPRYRN
ncbi:putative rna binding domain-containing protein [Limtongia smithiae]|uniref:putative rna binding domain-containing protein n=1 Tax=Limtongia smithiae TaxID=1125753 RepID=UPI0034CD8FB9